MRLLPAQFPSELLVEIEEMFPSLSPPSAITERRPTTNHPNNAGQKNGIYPNIYIFRLIMTVSGQKMVKYYEYYRVRVNLERDKGN
jgi:hypothetical protein